MSLLQDTKTLIFASLFYRRTPTDMRKAWQGIQFFPSLVLILLFGGASIAFITEGILFGLIKDQLWIGVLVCGVVLAAFILGVAYQIEGILILWKLIQKRTFNKGFPKRIPKDQY
jgi:hypothetical protein